jgi:hypothetical protein
MYVGLDLPILHERADVLEADGGFMAGASVIE